MCSDLPGLYIMMNGVILWLHETCLPTNLLRIDMVPIWITKGHYCMGVLNIWSTMANKMNMCLSHKLIEHIVDSVWCRSRQLFSKCRVIFSVSSIFADDYGECFIILDKYLFVNFCVWEVSIYKPLKLKQKTILPVSLCSWLHTI